ncbi:hypothetical protein ACTXGQ_05660 [Marinobacter sp. 1Y8]
MVVRIFLILLALNSIAFVVRADAAEHIEIRSTEDTSDLYTLQNAMSGDFEQDTADTLADVGSRLLRWQLTEDPGDKKRYAYETVRADHGVALIEDGACLNLKWDF